MITATDCRPWVARIKDQCPHLQQVRLTVPDAELTIDALESPVAFVYLDQEDSRPNTLISGFRQSIQATVAVELVIRRTASMHDRYSEADAILLYECRSELLTALCGWLPSDDVSPISHVTAQLSQKTEQVIKFIDRFTLTRFNRLDY